MTTPLEDFRAKYPQYADMTDSALSDALYRKYYSDMPRDVYDRKMGVDSGATVTAKGERGLSPAVSEPGFFAHGGTFDQFNNRLVNAATFGLSDEVGALGAATGAWMRRNFPLPGTPPAPARTLSDVIQGKPGPSFWSDYNDELQRERGLIKKFGQNHPYLAPAVDVVGAFGGIGPGGAVVSAATPASGSMLRQAGRYGMTMLKGAGVGAAAGALGGFGSGQGTEDRLTRATLGGAGGAVVGGALKPVADVIGGTWSAIKAALGVGDNQAAQKLIVSALQKDGLTLQDAIRAVANWRLGGAKPDSLAELGGDATKRLVRSIYTVGGEGASKVEAFLSGRGDNRLDRVMGDLGGTLAPQRNVFDELGTLGRLRAREAGPLYDQAYGANPTIASPDIADILNTPAGKAAYKQSAVLMANDGLPVPKEGAPVSLQQLDYAKRALDDQIAAAKRSGAPNEVRILTGMKNRLLAALDQADQTGLYAKARAAWAGPSESMDAINAGREFLKQAPEEIAAQLRALSPSEQEFYRIGAMRALQDSLSGAGGTNSLMAAYQGGPRYTALRGKIQALFPDSATYQKFADLAARESAMTATERAVLGGSQTANKAADVLNPAVEAATDIASGGVKAFIAKNAMKALARGQGVTQSRAALMAPYFTATGPGLGNKLLRLSNEMDALELQRLIRSQRGQGAQAAAGGLLSRVLGQ